MESRHDDEPPLALTGSGPPSRLSTSDPAASKRAPACRSGIRGGGASDVSYHLGFGALGAPVTYSGEPAPKPTKFVIDPEKLYPVTVYTGVMRVLMAT
jgi:hypothetical protein